MTGLMQGKRGLIMGLANDRSLAWGIAKALGGAGAELAFSYQGEAMAKRVRPLAQQLGSDFLIDCDVADMEQMDRAFAQLAERWPTILEHCSFDYMKRHAELAAPLGGVFWEGGARTFIHKGTNGRWRDVLSREECRRYEQLALEQLGADCAAWLATGAREA